MTTTPTTSRPSAGLDPAAVCPLHVRRPVMLHRWDELTFLHWRYEAAEVQRLLPDWLTVETFDGTAWVGLVPFVMEVTVPGVPPLPWLGHFPETNVRTYVRAPDGSVGVWFLSLDAARAAAVATARVAYQLPYFWSAMDVSHVGDVVTYRSRRRRPGPRGARCDVAVEVGEPFGPGDLGPLDHWLTARWKVFSPGAGRHADAEHPPWELRRATLLHLDEDLVSAAGLTAPVGPPLVHWSAGTPVRISAPRRIASPAAA